MTEEPYKRKAGDFEIRVLPDGRLVFLGPDQQLIDIANEVSHPDCLDPEKERNTDDTRQTGPSTPDAADQEDCQHE